MGFRFSLEAILRLRRSEQRQQELILQRVNDQVNGILRELENIEQQIISINSSHSRTMTSAEYEFDGERIQLLSKHRLEAGSRLQHARQQQAFAATEFQRAWQRREVLETLQKREQETYLTDQARRMQAAQDELYLQQKRSR